MTEERTITPLDEVDIDMEAAADALFLGPQASLIEKIQDFNSRYGSNFSRKYNCCRRILYVGSKYFFKVLT